MNKKSFLSIVYCFVLSFIFISCNNLFSEYERQTALTIKLPYGTERAAVSTSYNFKITFTHESGTETIFEEKSGKTITLSPAEVGKYVISGEAYNDKAEVIFKGETTAIVVEGEETLVSLSLKRQMYEVESQTSHMTLYPDEKGIKIVLNAVEGDGNWSTKAFKLIEKASRIEFEIHGAPTEKEPMVLYYPFTEKGKAYDFELSYQDGSNRVIETESCMAGGGESDYFDFTDYLNTKIILDSSDADKDTIKLSYDVTKAVNASKIEDGKFLDVGIFYSIYSGKKDSANNVYIGSDILTKYSTDGYEINYNPILTGLNLTERFISNENYEALKDKQNWFADMVLRFRLASFPAQDFVAPCIVSDNFEYKKAKQKSDHMTLMMDEKGIKIVLNALEGDGDWREKSFKLVEKESQIEFELQSTPTIDSPKVLYYPFTEIGNTYDFELSYKEGKREIIEAVSCVAGGGDGNYFDFTDYLNTDIILDSSAEGKDTIKLSYDVTNAVNASKIADNKFLDIGIIFSIYSGKTDWSDTAYVGTELLTKYSNEGFELNYDQILTELNLTEHFKDNENVNLEMLQNKYEWFADLALRFRLADFPDQDFVAPFIVSENYEYKKAIHNSEHVTVKPDEKGIKVTFNYLPGDGNWNTDYYLESADGKYSLNFVENAPPTAANPTVTYYLAITEKDKYYEYNFVMKNGGAETIEKVSCLAGGGNAGVVNIPDSWDGYEFELTTEADDGILTIKNNLMGIFNVNGAPISRDNYKQVLDIYSYHMEVYAGGYNDADRLPVHNSMHGDRSYGDVSFAEPAGINEFTLYNQACEEIFRARDKWSLGFTFNIAIKDTNTILSLRKLVHEEDYPEGTNSNDFVEVIENVPGSDDWTVRYFCPSDKVPVYSVLENTATSNGISIQVDEINEDFFSNYRLQFRVKVKPDVEAYNENASYKVNCVCDHEAEIEFEMYDINMTRFSPDEHARMIIDNPDLEGAPFPAMPERTYYYVITISEPGTYEFTNIIFNSGD